MFKYRQEVVKDTEQNEHDKIRWDPEEAGGNQIQIIGDRINYR